MKLVLLLLLVFTAGLSRAQECKDVSSKPEPIAKWKMSGNVQVVVCEIGYSAKQNADQVSGWINVFEKKDKLIPYIAEVKSENPSETYSFTVQRKSDTQIAIIRNIISKNKEATGDADLQVTERDLACNAKGCDLSPERCLKPVDKKVDKEAIKTVEKVIRGKQDVTKLAAYDVVIGKLIESAVAGDKKALKLVMKTSAEKMKADGAAAETLDDGKALVAKLVELKCVKP